MANLLLGFFFESGVTKAGLKFTMQLRVGLELLILLPLLLKYWCYRSVLPCLGVFVLFCIFKDLSDVRMWLRIGGWT